MTKFQGRAPLARPASAKDKEEQKRQAIIEFAAQKRIDVTGQLVTAACSGAGADLKDADADAIVDGALRIATAYVAKIYGVTFGKKEGGE